MAAAMTVWCTFARRWDGVGARPGAADRPAVAVSTSCDVMLKPAAGAVANAVNQMVQAARKMDWHHVHPTTATGQIIAIMPAATAACITPVTRPAGRDGAAPTHPASV